jgi:alkylated DNA repair dioxygenase AlkB
MADLLRERIRHPPVAFALRRRLVVTRDLFPWPDTGERIDMADADVRLFRSIPLPAPPDRLLADLIGETPWRAERIVLFGKQHLQPRLTAWYGDPDRGYRYSGLDLAPQPWTPLLSMLKRSVETVADANFNSVLLNRYRDHRDSLGMHSDDEPELGVEPVIASLSQGETRTLVFRHRSSASLARVRIPLPSGSLLVMRGRTQANWKHGIDKQTRICGQRVNLTFRRIVAMSGRGRGG